MHDFRWPEDYNDIIQPSASMILEMVEGYHGTSLLRNRQYFYFGKTAERGVAIWLDLMSCPVKETCYSLSIPLDEVSEIVARLLNTPIGTGPKHNDIEGSVGIVRVSTCQNHEMSMKWHATRAESWSGIFSIIDEIRDNVLRSPDHVAIPPREWPKKKRVNWDFPD